MNVRGKCNKKSDKMVRKGGILKEKTSTNSFSNVNDGYE